ncbi:MAG TPA: MarR family transcriptional regulator [Rickettsiales bacterium]|nr:MarR family transcriptional regulator [Rickettsiales bacterium]
MKTNKYTASPDLIDRICQQWESACPQLDTSALGTIGRILRIESLAAAPIRKTLTQYGLDRSGLDVLATLRRVGPPFEATPTLLYKSLALTSGAITNRIDSLERAGLVQRHAASEDRRSQCVRLTDKGKQLIDEAFAKHLETEASMVAHLSAAERQTLEELLRKILLRLEEPND